MNRMRVYKQMASSTVLIASTYVSAHHNIVQAARKGLGAGVLINEQDLIVADAYVLDGLPTLR
jgi:hypothetical protein